MQVPTIQGVIDRRILINFRVCPRALSQRLPEPFRPKLVDGRAVGGICLIRLKHIRPLGIPRSFGHTSENCAHRVAVEWDDDGQTREGVFIFGRHSGSRLNTWLGGRVFPGVHHRAKFDIAERGGRYHVAVTAKDMQVGLEAQCVDAWPDGSVFASLEAASEFFQAGSVGYSAAARPGHYEGMELRSFGWNMRPLEIQSVYSSFFNDKDLFPPGTVEVDSAVLMRGIPHQWHASKSICECAMPALSGSALLGR